MSNFVRVKSQVMGVKVCITFKDIMGLVVPLRNEGQFLRGMHIYWHCVMKSDQFGVSCR